MRELSDLEIHSRQMARSALYNYRAGEITLRRLVGALDTIWHSLESSEWEEKFRRHWAVLDESYAVAVDRDELENMPTDVAVDIETAIQGLENLLSASTTE